MSMAEDYLDAFDIEDEERFDGRCPYTDRPCKNAWDCANCEVETEERLWADMMEGDEGDEP